MRDWSYYLAMPVLKWIGPKKIFSKAPMDFKAMRRYDKKLPPRSFARRFKCETEPMGKGTCTKIVPRSSEEPKHVLFYVPGGAFVSGPAQHHWDSLRYLLPATGYAVWMADYGKAPESKLPEMHQELDAAYAQAVQEFGPERVVLAGDSAGANLIMTLVQRQIAAGNALPRHLVLITPVCDATMTNPEIESIDPKDPMLGKAGAYSAKKMAAGEIPMDDPQISPINGSFEGFPPSTLYLAGRDILRPDGFLTAQKMLASGVQLDLVDRPHMPHIFPLLPVLTEAKRCRKQLAALLNGFK